MNVDAIREKYAMDAVDPLFFGQRKVRPELNLPQFRISPYWPSGTPITIKAGGRLMRLKASGAPETALSMTIKAKTKEDAIKKWIAKCNPTPGYKLEIK